MAIYISKKSRQQSILKKVMHMTHIDVHPCVQCKKCANGCPVATLTTSSPAEIIRKLRMESDQKVLQSDLLWMCVSCGTCVSRCPMKIDMPAVIDELRKQAQPQGKSPSKDKILRFNRIFLKTLGRFGRSYDLAIIAAYRSAGFNRFQDLEKLPIILQKRKIALMPSLKANRRNMKKIFNQFKRKDRSK